MDITLRHQIMSKREIRVGLKVCFSFEQLCKLYIFLPLVIKKEDVFVLKVIFCIIIRGVARHVNECRHKIYGERSWGRIRPPAGPGQCPDKGSRGRSPPEAPEILCFCYAKIALN